LALKFNPIYASNSKAAGKFIAEKHGQDVNEVSFIPNPFEKIAIKTEKVDWRLKLGIAEDEIMLFMAANFFPEKDHETLIKGFQLALKQNSKIKLVLAGSQNYVDRINFVKAMCFDMGMCESEVVFLGSSDDVPGLINASDICLLTSISEGSPNALIEYMGYGKPIVASAIPSIVELLKPEYAFLFEPQNSEDLSLKIIELISFLGTDYCQNIVKVNKNTVSSEYTIEANYNAFHKLLSV
jgi:glycosyltransferase involved in cell wall biosynthesis